MLTRYAVDGNLAKLQFLQGPAVVVSIAAAAALIGFIYAVSNRLLIGCAVGWGALAFIAASHVNKSRVLDRPLAPWDLLEWRQIFALLGSVAAGNEWTFVLGALGVLVFVALFVVSMRRRPLLPLRWPVRLLTVVLAAGYLTAVVGYRHPKIGPYFSKLKIINLLWDPKENVIRNGLILSLLMNTRALIVHQPGYSRTAVESAIEPYRDRLLSAPEEAPDIIVYMGEALWDPTLLGVRFSTDPMPNMRRMMAEHSSGSLLTPTFGGGTSNVEFEVLTGIPMAIFPSGSVPYQSYVKKPLEALPSLLKGQGYRTIAIHTFHRWFWSRDEVYPLLGFDRFIALNEFPGIPYEGPFPSDEPLVDRVIEQVEGDPSRPLFLFAISMVTHGPYQYPRSPNPEVRVLDSLSEPTVHDLENYASALFRADKAIGRLVDFLASRERKTLLVVFGDHLPTLGANLSVFKETGFIHEAQTREDWRKMAAVPVALWTNYPSPKRSVESGMPFLSPVILRAAGFSPPGYFALLDELSQKLVGLRGDFVVTADGQILVPRSETFPADLRRDIDSVFLLGFDRLLGKNHSAGLAALPAGLAGNPAALPVQ
ncbi:MAG: LTA synthase family protein [Myxococcales bacterium]